MQGFAEVQIKKKNHALSRLLERFGTTLSDEEYNKIVYDIKEYINKPVHINELDGKSFHLVKVGNDECMFLFDWEYGCLLTVYYKKWFKMSPDGNWERNLFRPKAKHIRYKNRKSTLAKRINPDIVINMYDLE